MRQRRLAKLGASNATSASSNPKSDDNTKPETSTSSTPSTPSHKPSSSSLENSQPSSLPNKPANPTSNNPFSQLSVKSKPGSENTTAGTSGNSRVPKRSVSAVDTTKMIASPSKKMHAAEEKLEDWSNRTLGDIFRVTLDETKASDSKGTKLTYLPELKAELEQSGDPTKLTASSIDSAILEAAKYVPSSKPLLDYLLPCWKRVVKAAKPTRPLPPEKAAVLQEAKRLCMSNCIFALTMPEYFRWAFLS